MTLTLQDAIAEVKRTLKDDATSETTVPALHVIMNSFDRGDLVPKADADLAVALVVQKAGQTADAYIRRAMHLSADGYEIERTHGHMVQRAVAAILALAPADALAEVAKLREALGNIARQKLHTEMDALQRAQSDYIGGYEQCIHVARAALATPEKDATK